MSEDYKKIALEDVKVGQRVRIVEQYPAYNVMHEGVAVRTDAAHNTVDLGNEAGDKGSIFVDDSDDFYILLLEDAPKPKVVRTETVTITHYDDGTKTETPVKDIKEARVPWRIETPEQFEEYEFYLRALTLRDADWDYWTYRDGVWGWKTSHGTWCAPRSAGAFEPIFPLTAVEDVGD